MPQALYVDISDYTRDQQKVLCVHLYMSFISSAFSSTHGYCVMKCSSSHPVSHIFHLHLLYASEQPQSGASASSQPASLLFYRALCSLNKVCF